ncbi:MAG TPA: hypothetical protein VF549_17050 [Solirubrobacteraceae bacterium]|jgi:hypothetical protein
MTRHALLAASAAATMTLGTAAPAQAVVKAGTFAGTTSEADPIGFRVDGKGRVLRFRFEAVALTCSDGDTVATPKVVTPARVHFKVKANAFGIKARNETSGFGWDADGVFRGRGRRARGTLKIFASFNEQNQQDADGATKCESAALTWTAKRG